MDASVELVESYFKEKVQIANQIDCSAILKLAQRVVECYENDGTVYLAANGGPAGAIDSLATDLRTHPFVLDNKGQSTAKRRLRVVSLVDSVGIVTGISNDIGLSAIFVEQLKNHLRSGQNSFDVFIAFSGSGNSLNILNGIDFAQTFGVFTCGITGRGGGKLKELADLCILIPGTSNFPGQTGSNDNNFHIEDFQVSITHIVTGILKAHVAGDYAK